MTWEEKYNELFCVTNGKVGSTRFTYLMASDAKEYGYAVLVGEKKYPSLLSCLNAIKSGDIDTVRNFIEGHKNALETLRKVKRLFDSYKGTKSQNPIAEAFSSTCFHNGVLKTMGDDDYWAKRFLFLSRLMRDAETRCLKHPRHQQV